MTVTFRKTNSAKRGATTYKADGYPGTIQLSSPAFNGTHPDEITVGDVPDAVAGAAKVRKAGMTKEERKAAAVAEKARFAALTPEQKNQELRDKAAKRREAAAEALRKAEERAAKLAKPAA